MGDRTERKSGCPICAGRTPCHCNSLKALHPHTVQQQWDYELNTVKPEQLLPQSAVRVHWRCDLHDPPHSWTALPNQRFNSKLQTGCPECARLRKGPGKGA